MRAAEVKLHRAKQTIASSGEDSNGNDTERPEHLP